MTREDINKRLKRTNIKGKQYVEVNQRVLAFWELYPNGSIRTQLLSDDGDRCVFRAEVYDSDMLMATGHAFESKSSSMVNKTSYIENCETSAVGRALGMLGIGITDAIASAEEVSNAIAQQESGPILTKKQLDDRIDKAKKRLWAAINRYAELNGLDPKKVLQDAQQRDDWRETSAYYTMLAEEFEGAV